MEYYCNIYCNPRQDYFLKVDHLFQNESNEGKGVYNFTGLGSKIRLFKKAGTRFSRNISLCNLWSSKSEESKCLESLIILVYAV